MLPTKEEAFALLKESYTMNPGPWKDHSVVTAKCAYKIAAYCPDLDEAKAYILGLLHDIGRRFGFSYIRHVLDGYLYLMSLGYEEAAKISITHSFPVKSLEMYVGEWDVSKQELAQIQSLLDFYEYDDYDRLIQVCDSIAMPNGPVDMITRMEDVKTPLWQLSSKKWNKNLALKDYFEDKIRMPLREVLFSLSVTALEAALRLESLNFA